MKARQYNVQNEKVKKSSQQSTTQKTKNTETDVNQWRPDNTMFFCPFHFEHCIVWPSLIYVCLSIFSFLCSALLTIFCFVLFILKIVLSGLHWFTSVSVFLVFCVVLCWLLFFLSFSFYQWRPDNTMFKMKRSKKTSQQSTTQKTKNTETDINQWRPDNTMFKMKR
jgi:Flp pilus assembly protein TadB